jgi:hypothetical protein
MPVDSSRVRHIEEDFSRIAGQIERMLPLCNAEQFSIRATRVSGWSVGAQIDHLSRAGTQILGALEGVVETGEFVDHRSEAADRWIGRVLLRLAWFPRGVAEAPKSVVPEDSPSPEDVRDRLASMAASVPRLRIHAETLAASTTRRKHPRFGGLNATQWVRFVYAHQHHHLKIVREILAKSEASVSSKARGATEANPGFFPLSCACGTNYLVSCASPGGGEPPRDLICRDCKRTHPMPGKILRVMREEGGTWIPEWNRSA